MFSREASESMEGHVEGVAADGYGNKHFQEKNGDAVFVPGLAWDGVGAHFGGVGMHGDLAGSGGWG